MLVDGTIGGGGESEMNKAMITGESKPVCQGEGDEVIGGTINRDNLRVIIIIEFIINTNTFSLIGELILFPVSI